MSSQEDESDKNYEATETKLLEARRKGEVAKSNDLFTASAYAGFLLALLVFGEGGVRETGTIFMTLLDQADVLEPILLVNGPSALMGKFLVETARALLPLFLLPAIAVLLAAIAQRAVVIAPTKLAPKLSRISPISNAKNKFGRSGLFEFAKSSFKLIVYSTVLTYSVYVRIPDMLAVLQTSPSFVLLLMTELCIRFLVTVLAVAFVIGGVDAVWQRFDHLRKNMMSRKELTDEAKNNEGDPHMKQERRQRAMAASQNQMMRSVEGADVVIVNPTHFAVALNWSRRSGEAPVCVAKGVDEIAHIIREKALEASVPIHSDPPTARTLYATTEIGEQIAAEHFQAVATAIRFAQDMRNRARNRV